MGLFAGEPISKGTLIWQFVDGLDRYITDEELAALPQNALDFVYFYYYRSKICGQYVLLADNDRFTNHSYEPNTGGIDSLFPRREGGIALRDIASGEELVCDYSSFDADFPIYAHLYPRELVRVSARVSRQGKI